ncbi:MAG: DUF3336 domain-containing protein, partial [Parahaliea sp.]
MGYGSVLKSRRKMARAASYAQWHKAALEHDQCAGLDSWRKDDSSRLYDFNSIRARLGHLKYLRRKQDNRGLLFALNEGIHGNMDGMGNERLYFYAKAGTKKLIDDYVREIGDALEYLASSTVK